MHGNVSDKERDTMALKKKLKNEIGITLNYHKIGLIDTTKYFLIFCSEPPRYIIPGKQTIAATPLGASQDRECIINAISAFDFGANTPAGANL